MLDENSKLTNMTDKDVEDFLKRNSLTSSQAISKLNDNLKKLKDMMPNVSFNKAIALSNKVEATEYLIKRIRKYEDRCKLNESTKITLTIGQLRRLVKEAFTPDVVDRIKKAMEKLSDVQFSQVVDYRDRTLIKVNAANKEKARKILSSQDFANAIDATVMSLRRTQATGYTVQVDDEEHGKPVFMRIRSGGVLARGMGNEQSLISSIDGAINDGVSKIVFKDSQGGKFVVNHPVSVRGTGADPGSRMGNRGDVEIVDAKGVAHRISVKKDNANRIAGITRHLATRRLKIQQALNAFIIKNRCTISRSGNVTVRVYDPTFFRFCWFGLDINENGGVVIGNFENPDCYSNNGTTLTVNCIRAFTPNDDIDELIEGDLTSMYLQMKILNKRGQMKFFGAVNRAGGKRYELPGFQIDGITTPALALAVEDFEEMV